jgi:hypothetical protein
MQHQIYFCNIQMKNMQHTSETHETMVATCAHLLAAPNGHSWSLMPTRSSMPQRGGRTSAVHSASLGRRCGGAQRKVRTTRGESSAQHKARDAGGPREARGARREGRRVRPVRPKSITVKGMDLHSTVYKPERHTDTILELSVYFTVRTLVLFG